MTDFGGFTKFGKHFICHVCEAFSTNHGDMTLHVRKHEEEALRPKSNVTSIGTGQVAQIRKSAKLALPPQPKEFNRDEVIPFIRECLKKRSGKPWSVTGGTGTAWGWIKISAPPKRLIGSGELSMADRAELKQLLGLDRIAGNYESIPSSTNHYKEYCDRAAGIHPPRFKGEQYWD